MCSGILYSIGTLRVEFVEGMHMFAILCVVYQWRVVLLVSLMCSLVTFELLCALWYV